MYLTTSQEIDMQAISNKITIIVEGTPLAFRVVPHKSKPGWVVVKSGHPEIGAILAKFGNIAVGNTWKGSNFWITEFPKSELVSTLGVFLAGAIADVEVKALPTKCGDCGTDDGTHYNYCKLN
jgi:hypothetical protein